MIKKPVGLLLTAFLTMGLAACNNNDKNQINDKTTNQVGMNTTNRNNPYFNVGNGRDDGIDHNGPLTEDYTNRNNSESDLDVNLYNDQRKTRKNNRDMISSYQTSLNSDQYPHTRAILIQDAKYQYTTVDPSKGKGFQFGQQGQPFIQQQTPIAKAPVPAPAPQQTQPAVPAPAPQQTQPTAPAPQPKPAPKPAAPTQNIAPTTGTVSQYVQQVINLTNAQRSKNGLPALKADTQLNGIAQKKSVDMQQKNYFSHTSPTYGSPFDMMRDFGVTYKSAGENIAQGQRTPQEVVNSWMNSEGHRKNILSSNFTHIGVGFEETGKHWTQMFIGK
ncbi:CAP domain-containing protein [Neobacillus sp. WH10]|uniref:CAP domain-containing protein n=1 Tax=Neobacillus sp. WH10 TaxID=3047873 RepID=UPI0024C1B141|nr:CAP domain-containing protein [Neobacillus sp. WH10]WHY78812.1 CAP domain-containing protein [Neobacillus sp. WH10]